MSKKKDGGPAYPCKVKTTTTQIGELTGNEFEIETWQYQSGMSIRDWFAGMAMKGLLSSETANTYYEPKDGMTYEQIVALHAGRLADAMIEEREK